jgi:HEAT repeat protein
MFWWHRRKLQSRVAGVRRQAALALGHGKDRRAITCLVGAIADWSEGARGAARQALHQIDPSWRQSAEARSAVPILVAGIDRLLAAKGGAGFLDGIDDAVTALGQIRGDEAARAFAERLDRLPLKKVDASVLHALARDALRHGRDSSWKVADVGVRRAAEIVGEARDIEAIGPLAGYLGHREYLVRSEIRKALVAIHAEWWNAEAAQATVASYAAMVTAVDWRDRVAASEALGLLRNSQGARALLPLLHDGYEQVRAAAASALGDIGDDSVAETLLPLLDATSPREDAAGIRQAAIESIGKLLPGIRDLGRLKPLIAALQRHRVRLDKMAEGLARTGQRCVIAAIVEALPYGRDKCLRALKELDPDWPSSPEAREAVPALIEMLSGEDVRYDTGHTQEAIRWLGALGDARAIESLATLMENQEALRMHRGECAAALCALGDSRGTARCASMLSDPRCDPESFAVAAIALARKGDRRVVATLLSSLENKKDMRRWGAARALAELREPSAVNPLARMILEANVRTRALVSDLAEILGSSAASVRTEDLELVLVLPESVTSTDYNFDLDDTRISWSDSATFDLRQVRDLARAELTRRRS